jgi:hypothetical protein
MTVSRLEASAGVLYTSGQMLEMRLKTCHFLPLFRACGEIPRCRDSIGKSFHARQMRPRA